jgi:hypothetical protein
MYIAVLGLFMYSSLQTGSAFKFLSTLPIDREEGRKISLLTIFRMNDSQIATSLFGYAVFVGIIVRDFWVTLGALVFGISGTVFAVSVMILLGSKLSAAMNAQAGDDPKTKVIRILLMVFNLGVALILGLSINISLEFLDAFALSPDAGAPSVLWNLAVFPYGAAILITGPLLGLGNIPTAFLVAQGLSCAAFLVLTFFLAKKALGLAYTSTMGEQQVRDQRSREGTAKPVQVHLEINSKSQAFLKKDLGALSNDFQALSFALIAPLLIVLSSILGVIQDLGDETAMGIPVAGVLTTVYAFMTATMQAQGFMDLDASTGSLTSVLPVTARDMLGSKLKMICGFHLVGFAVATVINFFVLPLEQTLIYVLMIGVSWMPIVVLLSIQFIVIKVVLFGKTQQGYTLTEINFEHKALKWVAIYAMIIVELVAFLAGLFSLVGVLGAVAGILVFAGILVGLNGLVWLAAAKVFPRPVIGVR